MTRLALALAGALAVVLAPAAQAAGPAITYTVTSGTEGDNGWYTSDVTAQISVSGANDSTCTPVKTFRSSSDSLDCTATDGSSTVSFHLQFKIDKDAPAVTGAAADRGADRNGWFKHPLSIAFTGSDATSGIASCATVSYGGPDSSSASVSGTCRDEAGNVSAPGSFSLKYDATAPSTTAAAARAPDANGWYSHPVGVSFSGSDSGSGVDSCSAATTYSGPDAGAATVSGSCTDVAGNSASASTTLRYDATPPAVTASAQRPPDANGWYNHAVQVSFAGTDAGSGLAGCDAAKTYSRPDMGVRTRRAPRCTHWGTAAPSTPLFRSDATPPRLAAVAVDLGPGSATVRWKQPPDTTVVDVTRSPGRSGSRSTRVYAGRAPRFRDPSLRPGVAYLYTLTAVDAAGNSAVYRLRASARVLYAPAPGAAVKARALLRWAPRKNAAYYNVQLFRNGHKVLTTWVRKPQLRLPRSWRLAGKKVVLAPGRYRWYVWPGIGKPAAKRYGKLLGASTFVVRR
jgi:hypothetical protein